MHFLRPFLLLPLFALCSAVHAAGPANDSFAHAQPLSPPSGVIDGTTLGATLEKGDPGKAGDLGGDVWYSFTAPANGIFTAVGTYMYSGGGYLGAFFYEGNSLAKLKTDADVVGESGTGYATVVSAPVLAGKKYYFCVGFDQGDAGGAFQFNYAFQTAGGFAFVDPPGSGPHPWYYLEGANATFVMTVGRYGSSTGAAQVNYNIQSDPRLSGSLAGTLYFAPGVTRQQITLGLANANTSGSATLLCQLSQSSSNAVILPTGSVDAIIQGDAGAIANDDFANAQPIDLSGSPGAVVSGSVAFPYGIATVEQGEFSVDTQSIWYQVTAPAAGELTVAAVSNRILVYTGTSVASLEYAPWENNTDYEYSAQLPVTGGSTYYIAVNGIDDTAGYLDYSFDPNGSLFDFASYAAFVYDAKSKPSTLSLVVTRSGATSTAATVHYATNGAGDPNVIDTGVNLAVPNVDFVPTSGTLSFAPGMTSGTFQVAALRNPKDTSVQKHINVVLDNPSGALLGAQTNAYIYINAGNEKTSQADLYGGPVAPVSGQSIYGIINFDFGATLSVKAVLNGKTYTGHISDSTSSSTYSVPLTGPRGTDPLTVDVSSSGVDFENVLSGQILDGGTGLATFQIISAAQDLAYTGLAYLGSYTISLTSGAGAPASLQAPGWATLTVLPNFKYNLIGSLPNGARFTAGGVVDGLGFGVPLLASVAIPFKAGAGTLGGALTLDPVAALTDPAPSGDGSGSLQWTRPAINGAAAFSEPLTAQISQYVPASPASLFGGTYLELTIGSNPAIYFDLNSAGAAVFPANTAAAPKLTFTSGSGQFTGSLIENGKRVSFSGVILPNIAEGIGFIVIDGQSSPVIVSSRQPQ